MGNGQTNAGAFHWNEPRKLTLGELKRIMSLPDDFKLTGKWNQKAGENRTEHRPSNDEVDCRIDI